MPPGFNSLAANRGISGGARPRSVMHESGARPRVQVVAFRAFVSRFALFSANTPVPRAARVRFRYSACEF